MTHGQRHATNVAVQKDQKRQGGVLGKIFNPSADNHRRAGGNATQRAFQSSDGSVDFDDMRSSSGSNGASRSDAKGKSRGNGAAAAPKQKQRRRQQIDPKPLEGHQELEPALKKAANAGIFSMFDRLK